MLSINWLLKLFALTLVMSSIACREQGFTDNGRTYRANVLGVEHPINETEITSLIHYCQAKGIKLIAAGKHHSQGGQSFCEGCIVVDMTKFNRVIELNVKEKWIVVESGISWEKIQEIINPYGLAVKVMQSSNIFTVGGSISVNAHGRDPRFSALSSTIFAIKVLTADGHARWIDRNREPELFKLVIGGYGLFGFVLEAKISLTENYVLEKTAEIMEPKDYLKFVQNQVIAHDDVNLHFARFYIGADHPLSKMIAVSYRSRPNKEISTDPLLPESKIWLNRFLLELLRKTEWAKKSAWKFQIKEEQKQESISRNNAMRPPILALDYHSLRNTDILQEYFIPIEHFTNFTKDIQNILNRHSINLLNITIRYTKKNTDSLMAYAKEDSFAFVLYVNVGLSLKAQKQVAGWTQELIDAALKYRGTFYLPYHRYATQAQLYLAYPNLPLFLEQKKLYDPEGLFSSEFYKYLLNKNESKRGP